MGGKLFIMQSLLTGKLLAEFIQNSLGSSIDRKNNRVAKSIENIYIVENVEVPLAIVECGFLSNPEEAKLLSEDSYQDRIAFRYIYSELVIISMNNQTKK